MIPGNAFTPIPVLGTFLYLEDLPYDPLTQTVMGGIALNDPSMGRLYRPWTVSYMPPGTIVGPVDPFFSDVSSLLHLDGSFIDVKNNTWTSVGSAGISSSVYKFGGGSVYVSGPSSYVQGPGGLLSPGVGDFTVECWLNPTLDGNFAPIVNNVPVNGQGIIFQVNNDGTLESKLYSGGSEQNTVSSSGVIVANVWQHVAWSRANGYLRVFVNGIQVAGQVNPANINSGNPMHLGGTAFGCNSASMYIDDFRITPGVARYTANFAPPSAEFPDQGAPTGLIKVNPVTNSVVFTLAATGVTSVSLAFDNNMGLVIAWTTSTGANLYYYDTPTSSYVTRNFPGITSCRVCVDDPREFYTSNSDVIFGYTIGGNLCYRQQRDRYNVEYIIQPTTRPLIKMGPSSENRLQFDMYG